MDERSKEQYNLATKSSDERAASTVQDDTSSRSSTIRDGFSMSEVDYQRIEEIRRICLQRGIIATKSGILRAALKALSQLSPDEQVTLLQSLSPVRTGRPPSQK